MDKRTKQTIYLLTLENGKYYVGRTQNPERRLVEHLGGGTYWTTLHKPVKMTILKKNADVFDEDKYVKMQMAQKGIDAVRGGAYSASVLSRSTMVQLENEIRGATDRCFNCGKPGHFAVDCSTKKITIASSPQTASKKLTVNKCSLCGKGGHNKRTCSKIA